MGCIGMSRDEFERCAPSEFSRIHDYWTEREARLFREGWEQTRVLVSLLLPQYNYLTKSRKNAKQMLPFPWDEDNKESAPKGSSSIERVREVMARLNGE